jgi:ribosomal protein L20A (L18A)
MANYVVVGKIGRGSKAKPFEKQVSAPNEKLAREKVYALFGSNAGIKRNSVSITSVTKMQ